jgi:tripartite-type tricarboxylate transporter receptor subunit TctC
MNASITEKIGLVKPGIITVMTIPKLKSFAASMALALSMITASAQEFTVHHAAGGVSDMATRAIALHTQWPVVNRPGGGGRIAVNHVLSNNAVMLATVNQIFVNNALSKTAPDRSEELEILAVVAHMGNTLTCNRNINSWAELTAKPVRLGYGGMGSNEHLATEILVRTFDIDVTMVPYALGGNKSLQDLLGQHIDCVFFNTPTVKQHLNKGELTVLITTATWSTRAHKPWPFDSALALVTAKNNPHKAAIANEVAQLMQKSELREQLAQLGLTPVMRGDAKSISDLLRQNQRLKQYIESNKLVLE